MEQTLARRLPVGTKSRLRRQATAHGRSAEAEARDILLAGLHAPEPTLVDLLASPDTADSEFEPPRLGLTPGVLEL